MPDKPAPLWRYLSIKGDGRVGAWTKRDAMEEVRRLLNVKRLPNGTHISKVL